MYYKYISDKGFNSEEFFTLLDGTGSVSQTMLEASEVTVTPLPMSELMGNLDGDDFEFEYDEQDDGTYVLNEETARRLAEVSK